MAFFDEINSIIEESQEKEDFGKNFRKPLTQKQFNEITNKFMMQFYSKDEDLQAFKKALPKAYNPSDTNLKSQQAVQPILMKVITGVEVQIAFSPIKNAISRITIKNKRSIEAVGAYIDSYGTPETKQALYSIIEKEPFDEAAFKAEFLKRIPDEIRKASKHMEECSRKIVRAVTPQEKMDIYDEVRMCLAFAGESDSFFETFKNLFSDDERAKLDIQFGTMYMSANKFAVQTNALAHPLANVVDYNALSKLPKEEVLQCVDDCLTKPLGGAGQAKTEIYTFTGIVNSRHDDYNVWTTGIRNHVEERKQDILVRKMDGTTEILDEDVMEQLYQEGLPFYAIPIEACDKKDPVLCQPTYGHKLMIGKDVDNPVQVPYIEKPQEDNILVRAWDAIISVIGMIFNENWRVNSVRQYDLDMERYDEANRMREAAKIGKQQYSDNMKPESLKAAQKDLVAKAAEIKYENLKQEAEKANMTVEDYQAKLAKDKADAEARKIAKAEAEEKARIAKEAQERALNEKKEGLKGVGLNEKDLEFIAKYQIALEEYSKGGNSAETLDKNDFTRAFVAFTAKRALDNELERIKQSDDKKLGNAFDLPQRYGKSIGKYFVDWAEKLSDDAVYVGLTEHLTKEDIQKTCHDPINSSAASKLQNFSVEYAKAQTAEKEKRALERQKKVLGDDSKKKDKEQEVLTNNNVLKKD